MGPSSFMRRVVLSSLWAKAVQRVRWALWCGARGAVKDRGGLCPQYFRSPSRQVRLPASGRGHHLTRWARQHWQSIKLANAEVAEYVDK